ncbi:MAG: DJ-1/PfpI family protein [Candidatus Hydrogenedentes bacterium]|nr:DJ-1/PfpI family protein [Candidatus Hydrogenedentota bacterium]
MPSVLVPLAQGCEEVEATTIIDVLRRANINVVTAGLDSHPVTGSHGIKFIPDRTLEAAMKDDFDMVVLPGGLPGADNLNNDPRVHEILKKTAAAGKCTGAICAAPVVLAKAGLLKGKSATSYPGFLDKMGLPDVTVKKDRVVRDGKVITSRSPGTAMDFALEIVEMLTDKETRQNVETALQRV